MPTPAIPGVRLGQETGLQDQTWVTRARNRLRDYPEPKSDQWTADSINGVVSAGAMPVYASKKPLYDGPNSVVSVGVNGVDFPLSTVNPPAAGHVFVDYNLGAFIFNTPPALNAIVTMGFSSVKWTDQTILEALYAGLRAMFPTVGRTYVDTSVQLAVNTWDYQLPAWAQDPRARVLGVEVIETNIPTEPYKPLRNWRPNGDGTITIPGSQAFSPTAMLRITGWGPYLSLGDLEPQLYELPVLYCLGLLLADQETTRMREDTQVAQAQEGAHPPLEMMQLARHYMNLFETELKRLDRSPGAGFRRRILTTYERNSFS